MSLLCCCEKAIRGEHAGPCMHCELEDEHGVITLPDVGLSLPLPSSFASTAPQACCCGSTTIFWGSRGAKTHRLEACRVHCMYGSQPASCMRATQHADLLHACMRAFMLQAINIPSTRRADALRCEAIADQKLHRSGMSALVTAATALQLTVGVGFVSADDILELPYYLRHPEIGTTTSLVKIGAIPRCHTMDSQALRDKLTVLACTAQSPQVTTDSSKEARALVNKLNESGAKMYGAFWCSHCFSQKQVFGKEVQDKFPYIECYPDGWQRAHAQSAWRMQQTNIGPAVHTAWRVCTGCFARSSMLCGRCACVPILGHQRPLSGGRTEPSRAECRAGCACRAAIANHAGDIGSGSTIRLTWGDFVFYIGQYKYCGRPVPWAA
eukprot:363869-Chlamydomonas_euryale.AAC.20